MSRRCKKICSTRGPECIGSIKTMMLWIGGGNGKNSSARQMRGGKADRQEHLPAHRQGVAGHDNCLRGEAGNIYTMHLTVRLCTHASVGNHVKACAHVRFPTLLFMDSMTQEKLYSRRSFILLRSRLNSHV